MSEKTGSDLWHLTAFTPPKNLLRNSKKSKSATLSGYQRIRRVIERLLETPGDADGRMHGPHQGRLKKYVGRRDYRLIYQWCERCRKEAKKLAEHCGGCCGTLVTGASFFFDLFHKNEQDAHLKHFVP